MVDLSPPSGNAGGARPRTLVEDRAARVRFRRALAFMAMTLVAPGSAQLLAGNRKVGRIALRIWIALVVAGVLLMTISYFNHGFALRLAFKPTLLLFARLGLMAGAIAWAALFIDAWRLGQPLTLRMEHRRWAVGVNGVLCFGVAGTLLFGAHLVGVQRDFVIAMFGDGDVTGAHDGRYNVLLVGGDSGASRWGLRTDSLTLASIDADTGRTVLIGLPRNMTNFPFKDGSVMDQQFPDGFDCDDCYLNGVNTWVGDHQDLFKDSDNPGMDATISAVEGITGLEVNYWAMVDLQGFRDLANAVGGVTINVRQPIAIGPTGNVTGYIQPGRQKLSGDTLLWYARSRATSDDYSRMARQKCVMNAMLQQLSPQTVLTHFEQLTKASEGTLSTDLPASEVGRFMDLAMKARNQKISTLSLVPPLVNTADPDISLIQSKIQETIDKAEGNGPAPSKHARKPKDMNEGSFGSYADGYTANDTSDLGASC
jgi:LCP family protein required for cell wall assembly